jgi:hypothetical protein
MSPYILGHMMLGVTVAATRNDLLSAESWQGQPGPIATAQSACGRVSPKESAYPLFPRP